MTKTSIKNTSGRKHITKKPFVKHRDELVAINSTGSGTYSATVKKSFEQFDLGLDRWGRQLFCMFQLKPGAASATNKIMTNLLRRVSYQLSKLGVAEYGYHWCREQDKSEGEHYHLALWIDGDMFRTSHSIAPIVQRAWEELGGFFASARRRYQYVDDSQSRQEALYWLSYLSKGKGKGKRPTQTKDHGMSRLKAVVASSFSEPMSV